MSQITFRVKSTSNYHVTIVTCLILKQNTTDVKMDGYQGVQVDNIVVIIIVSLRLSTLHFTNGDCCILRVRPI